MIRVLLCAEGVTDQGRDEYRDGEIIPGDGVFQILIKKLASGKEICFSVKKRSDIKRFTHFRSTGGFMTKELIKAKKLAAMAKMEECKHIAYHRDEDNKGFDEIYDQVHRSFIVAKDVKIRCLAIVPQHMTESWLLCDPEAFPERPEKPALPRNPEETWGNKDSDNHPKKYLIKSTSPISLRTYSGYI